MGPVPIFLSPFFLKASLSSPLWRGTMPAQPSNGFLNTHPDPIISLKMLPRGLFLSFIKIFVCFRDNNRAEADKADEVGESHKAIHYI